MRWLVKVRDAAAAAGTTAAAQHGLQERVRCSLFFFWLESCLSQAEQPPTSNLDSCSASQTPHVQRRRLVAQCAERLPEYRHLVHAAATVNDNEAAERVSHNLDNLEAGQVSALGAGRP